MQELDETFERIFTPDEKAALRGERFVDRELVGVDLSGSDLRDSSFERTILVRCNLAGADLRGARFISSDLRAVVFRDARLGDNRFDGTTFADVIGLNEDSRARIEETGGTFQPPRASRR